MTQEAIATRATNTAGVSVGTSLALETIIPAWPVFDPERVAPPKVNLQKYSRVWINLRTIARNLHNAVSGEYRETLRPENLGDAIAEEAWAVSQAIADEALALSKPKSTCLNTKRLPERFLLRLFVYPQQKSKRQLNV